MKLPKEIKHLEIYTEDDFSFFVDSANNWVDTELKMWFNLEEVLKKSKDFILGWYK